MELEESTCLTSGSITKPQSSRQYGTGTKTEIYIMDQNRKPMFKLVLEKAKEPEIKLPTSLDYRKSKRVPEKHLFLLY